MTSHTELSGERSRADSPGKISVILPVFNMEKTLERSIESVRAQTYPDWELIIVDDGSDDRSVQIADTYAKTDDRIRVFHIPNGGVSNARNFGIGKAAGEWIAFLDGDDVYLPSAFSDMLHQGKNADLIVGSFDIISDRRFPVGNLPDMCFKTDELPDDEVMETLWQNFLFAVVWNRLYRRSMIKPIFDPSLQYGEDTVFNLKSFSGFGRCAVLKTKTYVYTWPCNTVKPKALKGRLEILRAIRDYFPDNETMKRVSVISFTKIMRRYAAESFVYDFSLQEQKERFAICAEYASAPEIGPYEKYLPAQTLVWWEQIKQGEYETVTRDFITELQKQGKPLQDVFVKIHERGRKESCFM